MSKRTLTADECAFLYNALFAAAAQYDADANNPTYQRHAPQLIEQFKAQKEHAEKLADELFIGGALVTIDSD